DHVPAVVRVDPQSVLVAMHTAGAVGTERLAAIAGAVQRDAKDVDVPGIIGVDADLAEVHRPRVQTVDAPPGVAAIVGAIDTGILGAVGALAILDVLDLSAQRGDEGPVRGSVGAGGAVAEGQVDDLDLLAAATRHLELVARLVAADDVEQAAVSAEPLV